MDPKATGALARTGLTFSELCALYFSRALLECFAGTPMLRDLKSAFDKFEAVLSPAMKKFLDRLPRIISAKAPQAKRQDAQTYQTTARLLEASVANRVVTMRYHSQGSGREKEYIVHPHRLVHAQGGLYLIAFVPAYSEVRTFAIERVRRITPQEQTFEPVAELESDPFRNSLGVHRGDGMKVQLRFHRSIAPSIRERTWHASQHLKDRSDGSVVMTLQVSDDYALRSWILGFGRLVRVMAPGPLVEWVEEELDQRGSTSLRAPLPTANYSRDYRFCSIRSGRPRLRHRNSHIPPKSGGSYRRHSSTACICPHLRWRYAPLPMCSSPVITRPTSLPLTPVPASRISVAIRW